jgi:UPF0176 protein
MLRGRPVLANIVMTVTVEAFYKFVAIAAPPALRDALEHSARDLGVRGTILIAAEGINATISAAPDDMAAFMARLRRDPRFADLESKVAIAEAHPFRRLKVKVKPEIVTFRQSAADPSVAVGAYVTPQDWNALISDPEVVVVDTRNAFEVAAGSFPGAIDPHTRRFSDFAGFVDGQLSDMRHRRIALFCTGGIRCEKATAYMRDRGFERVYHLKGGILAYLDRVPAKQSLWRGACVVFDERETVAASADDDAS